MITKKVNRYYCEYCRKSGGAAGHIKKHESRCTMNPNRHCGYCDVLDQKQSNLAELLALLPNPENYKEKELVDDGWISFVGLEKVVKEALPKLREITGSCPACIMAALRQKGIPVPLAKDFDFKKECREIWDEFNAARQEESHQDENSLGYY